MPIHKEVNQDFFKRWSPEMAYILGFFTADGNMLRNKRGAYFISIEITDKGLLEKIKLALGSNHKITARKRNKNWKTSYRLQIGSKEMFNDLLVLGIVPNKSKTILLPDVPNLYFSHFLRGYFDGDGSVAVGYFQKQNRKNKSFQFQTRFISGSDLFLQNLKGKLTNLSNTAGSISKQGAGAWVLVFSINDSKKLFRFMYGNGVEDLLYLERKYKTYLSGLVV